MDFVWSADSAGMTNPMTTTGDTIYSSSGSTPARLGIGSTGQILTVSGGVPTWANATSGMTKVAGATFSGVTSVSFPNNTFTSTYNHYLVNFNLSDKSTFSAITGRFRAGGTDNTSSTYNTATQAVLLNSSNPNFISSNATSFIMGYINDPGLFSQTLTFFNPQVVNYTRILGTTWGTDSGPNSSGSQSLGLSFNNTTQFDSFTFICASGTFSGDYAVYGMEK